MRFHVMFYGRDNNDINYLHAGRRDAYTKMYRHKNNAYILYDLMLYKIQ